MFSVTVRLVLLMVREEIDTARAPRFSSSLSETHNAIRTPCLILEIQWRPIFGPTADVSHLQRATPADCVKPPTQRAESTAHTRSVRWCLVFPSPKTAGERTFHSSVVRFNSYKELHGCNGGTGEMLGLFERRRNQNNRCYLDIVAHRMRILCSRTVVLEGCDDLGYRTWHATGAKHLCGVVELPGDCGQRPSHLQPL